MKYFQKILLMMMCVAMLGSLTGCGNRAVDDSAKDNASTNSATEDTDTANDMNNARFFLCRKPHFALGCLQDRNKLFLFQKTEKTKTGEQINH